MRNSTGGKTESKDKASPLVEEDWADLISSLVSPKEKNHFCFILKDRDSTIWDEEKDLIKKAASRGDQLPDSEVAKHSSSFFRLFIWRSIDVVCCRNPAGISGHSPVLPKAEAL